MRKKQTNTQVIDLLLKKIDKLTDISDSVKTNALENKASVTFRFANKQMQDQEISLRHKLLTFKEWDITLFNMLKVDVYFTNNITDKHMGEYYGSNIRMNRKYANQLWNTFVHEIGHAHNKQLGERYISDESKVRLKLIKELLEELSNSKITTNSFTSLKPYLSEYISWYAKKNINEAFAEIFALAYSEDNKYSDKRNACKRMIVKYNDLIYKGLSKEEKSK